MQIEISTKHGDSKESSNSLNVSIILLRSYLNHIKQLGDIINFKKLSPVKFT